MKTIATTTKKINSEELWFQQLKDFFDGQSASRQHRSLDYWLELIICKRYRKKWSNPTELLRYCDQLISLLQCCNQLAQHADQNLAKLNDKKNINKQFILNEQKLLKYFPNYLPQSALIDPLNTIKSIFTQFDLSFFQSTLQEWLASSLHEQEITENQNLNFSVYLNIRQLIGACWLIHERIISKNSYPSLLYIKAQIEFSMSCPHLFHEEHERNPYIVVESFFSSSCLKSYRDDLDDWFSAALNHGLCYEQANDLLFFHHQLLQLIQAGFLIASYNLKYVPQYEYADKQNSFRDWLIDINPQEPVINSHDKQINAPAYCKKVFTFDKVKKIRFYMNEWLSAALSKKSSIAQHKAEGLFEHYKTLLEIMETFYLILIQPTKIATNLNHTYHDKHSN